ncbi:cytochrome P450 [Mycolicibacterium smegmatis]|uniref:cytochrome P450 n=1 Tax=Mycolicibacterium smegmatis TaxID=1772 RepID=UPI003B516837
MALHHCGHRCRRRRHPGERADLPVAALGQSGCDRFEHADRFDIERNTRGHIAFGHGVHYCLGAPLARMEGLTAIGRIVQRYDSITLDQGAELRYHNGTLMHGLKSLPVQLTRAPQPRP